MRVVVAELTSQTLPTYSTGSHTLSAAGSKLFDFTYPLDAFTEHKITFTLETALSAQHKMFCLISEYNSGPPLLATVVGNGNTLPVRFDGDDCVIDTFTLIPCHCNLIFSLLSLP